jgi:hypothetical protein
MRTFDRLRSVTKFSVLWKISLLILVLFICSYMLLQRGEEDMVISSILNDLSSSSRTGSISYVDLNRQLTPKCIEKWLEATPKPSLLELKNYVYQKLTNASHNYHVSSSFHHPIPQNPSSSSFSTLRTLPSSSHYGSTHGSSHHSLHSCSASSLFLPVQVTVRRERFLHHFPHFAEPYFRIVSLLLWQLRFFNSSSLPVISSLSSPSSFASSLFFHPLPSCYPSLLIHRTTLNFWSDIHSPSSWLYNIVKQVNSLFHHSSVISDVEGYYSPYSLKGFSSESEGSMSGEFLPSMISMTDSETYFLHPSDNWILASSIMKEDPCRYSNPLKQKDYGKELSEKRVKILLLNREDERQMLNVKDITTMLQSVSSSVSSSDVGGGGGGGGRGFAATASSASDFFLPVESISHLAFEGQNKSFSSQYTALSEVDIVISVHGAQLTNLIFMKPCSIIIEVFPWLYNIPSFFGSLATSTDILHYSWEETPWNCQMNHYRNSQKYPSRNKQRTLHTECSFFRAKYLSLYLHSFYNHTLQGKSSLSSSGSSVAPPNDWKPSAAEHYQQEEGINRVIGNLCYKDGDGKCRSCSRSVAGINISVAKLKEVLRKALSDRKECILKHPLYNQ